jgi:hypothetical protein
MVIDFAAIRARNVKPKPEECVGRFARSIESGWLGKIIEVVNVTNTKGGRILKSSETMFRMKGVNTLCHLIQGGDMNDFLDDDDVQWFAPADVRFVKVV